jgi:hypothetical protein
MLSLHPQGYARCGVLLGLYLSVIRPSAALNETSQMPSVSPSSIPSQWTVFSPSVSPSFVPSVAPSSSPIQATSVPPSASGSFAPSIVPSSSPIQTTSVPPSASGSFAPSMVPSSSPRQVASLSPSTGPSHGPSIPPTNDLAHLSVNGTWSPVGPWPLSPIHMILLKNGKVLTYGQGSQAMIDNDPNSFFYDVWNPSLGLFNTSSHNTLPTQTRTNMFCGGQVNIPGKQGEVLIMGGSQTINGVKNCGTNHTQIFSSTSETLYLTGKNMYHGRWYPSVTVLGTGNIVAHVSTSTF